MKISAKALRQALKRVLRVYNCELLRALEAPLFRAAPPKLHGGRARYENFSLF